MNSEQFLETVESETKKPETMGRDDFPFRFLAAAARLLEGVVMDTAHDFSPYDRGHLAEDSTRLAVVISRRIEESYPNHEMTPAVQLEMTRLRDLHRGDVFNEWPFGIQLFVAAAGIVAGTVYDESRQYDKYDEEDLRLDGVQLAALPALNLEAGKKEKPAKPEAKAKRKTDHPVTVSHRNYARMQRFATPMEDDFNSTLSKIMDLAEPRREAATARNPEMFYDLMNRITGRIDRRKTSGPGEFNREDPIPETIFREIPETGAPKLEVPAIESLIQETPTPEMPVLEGQVREIPADEDITPEVPAPEVATLEIPEKPAPEPGRERKPRLRCNAPPEPSTPQNNYRRPIMEALRERSSQAPAHTVIELVHQRMEQSLHPADEAKLGNGRPRWKKMVEWARKELVTEGKLSDKSSRGTWELTAAGFSEVGGPNEPEYQLRESLR